MRSVWPVVFAALFRTLRPAVVVDVGGTPDRVAALADAFTGPGRLVVADGPDAPPVHGGPGVRIEAAGLDMLPAADLVVIDGEPSWDAVSLALAAVVQAAAREGRRLPVIAVGGADWPHGRRDGYRDLGRARHETATGGLRLGDAEPDPDVPAGPWVLARAEGGPHNGVRTAVEDFVAGAEQALTVVHVPGDGGVLLLAEPDPLSPEPTPEQRAVLALAPGPDVLAVLAVLEQERLRERARAQALAGDDGMVVAGAPVTVLASRMEEMRRELQWAIEARLDAEERLAAAQAASVARGPVLGPGRPLPDDPTPEEAAEHAFRSRYLPAWSPDERDLDEDARGRPQPLDVRGVLDEDAALHVAVPADGTAADLDRTVASVLDHATRPLRLTLDIAPAGDAVAAHAVALALRLGVEVAPAQGADVVLSGGALAGPGFPDAAPPAEEDGLALPASGAPVRVAFVLAGASSGIGGGVHSVAQEAAALHELGVDVRVLVGGNGAEHIARAHPATAPLLVPTAGREDVSAALAGVQIAVATEYTTVADLQAARAEHPALTVAYYVQDYEPFFAPAGSERADDALLSYGRLEDVVLFAKTDWVRNVVQRLHGVPVHKVSPSLDTGLFHPGARPARDVVHVAAMVRPRSPRRRPAATRRLLERLVAEGAGRVRATAFGCTDEELAALDPAPVGIASAGVLDRAQVADLLRDSDVFVDLSIYQAFGRTGLEAMACGAVPVLPMVGGVREYARHGENAVLVDTGDAEAALAAVRDLVARPDLRSRLRAAGERDALAFSSTRAAVSEYRAWTLAPAAHVA